MFLCDLCVLICTHLFVWLLLCRLEMETWCVCGSWLESAWLNTPPPSAPGPTARGFVGLFLEELHASWSTATTRLLIFPPYLSQPIKSGAINGWPFWCAEKTSKPSPNSCSGLMQLLGDFLWQCGHVRTAPLIFLTDVHPWWWISLRKSSSVTSFLQVFFCCQLKIKNMKPFLPQVVRNRFHPASKFYFCWLSCLQKCTVCSCLNPCQGVWSFLERVAGFKQISIEPPRSSIHYVEEEGEGFCEQQKWNQEIGPKVLNFHPRSLNCPECTLLPKVMFLFFLLFFFGFSWHGEGIPVSSG